MRKFFMIKHAKMKCVVAICVVAQVATVAYAAESAAVRAEVVSLDGMWQAEVAPDAQGETLPTAFTRTIPVPGHWPLMKPSAPCGKTEALWCRTTWKAPAAIPPRAFFSQIKSIGWDSFRQCISAPPDFWYDLCDEMGLLIQVQFAADGISVEAFEMSAPGDKKPWVEIDLGEERDVTSCKIHWFRVWKKPPAKWRVTPTLPARTRYIFVEISDISPNKLASIEEIEIHWTCANRFSDIDQL